MNAKLHPITTALAQGLRASGQATMRIAGHRRAIFTAAAAVGAAWLLATHPPLEIVPAGELAVRTSNLDGRATVLGEGPALMLPAVHAFRRFPLRDQVSRPGASAKAPFQSVEGLSFGADIAVRWAVDPAQVAQIARKLPDDIDAAAVEPALQAVIYKTFSRYTVREIFSSKRLEIQQAIEGELKPRLAADGLLLRSVQIGKVELPADYRQGMERLLAEELQAEKMRYTLELKEKQVRQSELEGLADKARRETAAAAAASEQVIGAKAQEEAMRHVLPFKQAQIEQRRLEAEAEKGARIKQAEAAAAARRIEADGEADSREKLADAEAYRIDRVGKVTTEQMAREGALLTKHPLLIQKTVADKLSDKVQVIIAPPGTDGRFIASGLVGRLPEGQPEALRADDHAEGAP